jgi:hypothetical protein
MLDSSSRHADKLAAQWREFKGSELTLAAFEFHKQKGFGYAMKKLALLDLESKILLLAVGICIGSCIWGAAQSVHSVSAPNLVGEFCVVAIGILLTTWCSSKGLHAIARAAMLSVCFGSFSFLSLIQTRHIFLPIAAALIAVSYALEAVRKLRHSRRGAGSSIAPVADVTQPSVGSSVAPHKLSMMPVRDMVVVPGMTTPFVVGRESSVRALEYAKANNNEIFLATQHDDAVVDPRAAEISKFGCICKVLQSIKMADGNFKVLVEGLEMGKTLEIDDSKGFFFATVQGLNIKSEIVSTAPAA